MSEINTEYLQKCINTMEQAYKMLTKSAEGTIDYEIYRTALVKGFEMTIEQSGKLLKKAITPYFSSKKAADRLSFKDIFRHAHKYSLLTAEETERWMIYRDNRNNTAHDYGQGFADETVLLIENFIKDAKHIREIVQDAGYKEKAPEGIGRNF